MGDALVEKKRYTPEEYFLFEESAQEKHEYENGEIFAMSGGTFLHGLIGGNMITALNNALAGRNCFTVGSDVKVGVKEYDSFMYPDVMVICGKIEYADGRRDVVKNPVLIVEVLSESTESYDRGRKFKKYQSLPSFREYVLVSQTEPIIETFFRQDDPHWLYTLTEGLEAAIPLRTIDNRIKLSDVYQRVEWAS
ncbi:MAG: Uma2 family endonuclease [Cytophagales bacterium]|nr:Uma2 family endonuclease [Cytophagales bacterium]